MVGMQDNINLKIMESLIYLLKSIAEIFTHTRVIFLAIVACIVGFYECENAVAVKPVPIVNPILPTPTPKPIPIEDISVNLSGNWTGNNGLPYVLTQTNNRINFTEYRVAFFSQFASYTGTGFIQNNRIEVNGFDFNGLQLNINIEIINEETISFLGNDIYGNKMTITLSKNR
jgi:hypothetical protein